MTVRGRSYGTGVALVEARVDQRVLTTLRFAQLIVQTMDNLKDP